MDKLEFVDAWLHEAAIIAEAIPRDYIVQMANLLANVRKNGGRVFVLGVGGSAANASHAVNDLRRIARIEAYAPTDNVAEFSALINDCGWRTTFQHYLIESRLRQDDALLILSVNGGLPHLSSNLMAAVSHAQSCGAWVLAILGRKDGYVAKHADVFVAIPCPNEEHRTPHSESFQEIVWHCLCHLLREDLMNSSVAATPAGVPTV